jgi:hypothetical protein
MWVHIFGPVCGRFDNLIARDAYRGLFPALTGAYAVNRAVNSVKNDTEECIEPAPLFGVKQT